MTSRLRQILLPLLTGSFLLSVSASAQWSSESYTLKPGYNAIWLTLDCSDRTIDAAIPNTDIEEIWQWNAGASDSQFTESPSAPMQADAQWFVWKRGLPGETTFSHLSANTACLVKVKDTAPASFPVDLVGKPAPPNLRWKSSGVNFVGFPMGTTAQTFTNFFALSPALNQSPPVFFYDGGPLVGNPSRLVTPNTREVKRGQAYWVQTSDYTDFYGPLQVTVGSAGLEFGDTGSLSTLRVRNGTGTNRTVVLTPRNSATPPGGPSVAGEVPLRLRGSLNPTTLEPDYVDVTTVSPAQFVLEPGETRELVFAVNRAAMPTTGGVYQSLLEVSDAGGLTRIVLPVRAVTTSLAGLWVGTAAVSRVDQIERANQRSATAVDDNGDPAYVTNPDGSGVIETNTSPGARVPEEFPVRLILHRDAGGTVTLLQRVYLGEDSNGNPILTTNHDSLNPSKLASAKRLSSATFPKGTVFPGAGDLGLSGSAVFADMILPPNAPTNPFFHVYHPDHQAADSLAVTRTITLSFAATAGAVGLSDLNWGSTTLGGTYSENIVGLRSNLQGGNDAGINVSGAFVLHRVSDLDTLTP